MRTTVMMTRNGHPLTLSPSPPRQRPGRTGAQDALCLEPLVVSSFIIIIFTLAFTDRLYLLTIDDTVGNTIEEQGQGGGSSSREQVLETRRRKEIGFETCPVSNPRYIYIYIFHEWIVFLYLKRRKFHFWFEKKIWFKSKKKQAISMEISSLGNIGNYNPKSEIMTLNLQPFGVVNL